MNIRTCIHSLQCQSNFIVKNSKIWASAATWNKMLLPVIVNWPSLCLSNNFLDDVFQIFVKYFLVRKERLIDLWKNSCFIKKLGLVMAENKIVEELPWHLEWIWVSGYSTIATLTIIFNMVLMFAIGKNRFLHFSFHYAIIAMGLRWVYRASWKGLQVVTNVLW